MKKIECPVFPTAYFPPLSYFTELIQYDCVMIEVKETYPKQTLRNRCSILTSNGPNNLSVPVTRPGGNHSTTESIQIFQAERWQIRHLRALEAAYKSSPYFDHYIHHFEPVFHQKFETLIELNALIYQIIGKLLKISTSVKCTDHFQKSLENQTDKRNYFDSKPISPGIFFEPYTQVFSDRFRFEPNLSILDLIFNLGPESREYLMKHAINQDTRF